jgi:hypothetical protein
LVGAVGATEEQSVAIGTESPIGLRRGVRPASGQRDTGKGTNRDGCCTGGADEEFSPGRRPQFWASGILIVTVVIHPCSVPPAGDGARSGLVRTERGVLVLIPQNG